jgi:methylenetetrahydrofolate dehydrogenase (NADP+)/methenyltetrahydrofolate cyclohydrolase|tara:strand:+ start:37 stop:888 length:852 start_codon:yes stop_codon:yes gene_type:complete
VNNCIVLDGKAFAEKNKAELLEKVSKLKNDRGRPPSLAAILVGDDPASRTYVSMKEKACNELGIKTITHKISESSTTDEILLLIDELNADKAIDGILLQHPVPKHINEIECFNRIKLDKDVDGVTTMGFGNLTMGLDAFGSCTPLGIMRLIKAYDIECEGKLALVVGRSQILGKPMVSMLLNANATTITAHSKTKNLDELLAVADIVVAAVGIPNFIDCKKLKKGSILIDAGYHPDKKCGDVNMDGITEIVSAYTPVPGGVGPMTINTLIYNTILSMEKLNNV